MPCSRAPVWVKSLNSLGDQCQSSDSIVLFGFMGWLNWLVLFLKFSVMHTCNTIYTVTRYIIYLMVLHDNLLKKEEKHTDIQYKSKPKYILWQHRTFHIPLWDKGHTTPEVFDFFFVKYNFF